MQILLAGATGVIGSRLLPRLIHEGHTVFGTTRRPDRQHQITADGGHPLIMDALVADSVREAVEQAAPELIMHQLTDLATLDFTGNADIRVSGTRHLVDAALAYGCSRMITQSIAWAYPAGDAAADETVPLDLDALGRGAATNAAVASMESATDELRHSVVLRYGLLYGPGTWFAPDGPRVDEARAGTLSAASAITNFVHVDDAVEAAVAALGWPAGVVNIVEDEPAPDQEWLPAFARFAGAETAPTPRVVTRGRAASNATARSLGWAPAHRWRDTWIPGIKVTGPLHY